MRYVILGTGAVGGSLGASLHRSGQEVVFVARGPQLEAIRANGLSIETPEEAFTVDAFCAASPREVDWREGDIAVLAVKSQDTEDALRSLAQVARPTTPILCLQNGVNNERAALRRFPRVYGAMVIVPATYLVPGTISVGSAPVLGICDVGRYPSGVDEPAEEIAEALQGARWAANASPEIMDWKYGKLLENLSNVTQIVLGLDDREGDLTVLARAEGLACLAAAGITSVSADQMRERRARSLMSRPVAGRSRVGASTWQSIERRTGSVETDYLNGEIVLLGRLHGVPTPVNAGLQLVAAEIARGARPAGSLTPVEFLSRYGGD